MKSRIEIVEEYLDNIVPGRIDDMESWYLTENDIQNLKGLIDQERRKEILDKLLK
jgi:predicted DNA-binding protein